MSFFSLFNRLQQDLNQRIWNFLRPLGINRVCFSYLMYINAHMPCRISELVETLHMDKASVTRSLSTLGKLGFIDKQTDKEHPRSIVLILTPAGQTVMQTVESIRQEWEEELRGCMHPDDYQTMTRILSEAAERYAQNRVREASDKTAQSASEEISVFF